MRIQHSVLAMLLCALLQACSSDPLQYDTALSLLKDRRADPVRITFSASPRIGESDPKIKEAYGRLIEGHVIDCKENPTVGMLCQPGNAGGSVTAVGSTDLSIVAGRWVPTVITRINRSGSTGATAEARLAFEPSSLYREYHDVLDAIQNSQEGRLSLADQKDGRNATVTFIRTEEGWQIETMQ